jgi:thiol-disulfide isomerase/thioredoxin
MSVWRGRQAATSRTAATVNKTKRRLPSILRFLTPFVFSQVMKNPGTLFFLSFLFISQIASAAAPRLAPDFTLPAISGSTSLHDLRGKVVYVDFWASWCAPCRESFPWMAKMLDRYGKDGLVILAINLDKTRDAANAFLDVNYAPFMVAFDPAGKTAEAFGVSAMPSSFIVGRSGEIVASHEGFKASNADEVESRIRKALAQ